MKRAVRKFKETLEIRSSLANRIRSHRYFPVALFVCVFLAASCIHVWQRVIVFELSKDVSRLKTENVDLADLAKKLRADIVTLESLTRIESYAADTLGFQVVTAERLVTLNREREVVRSIDELASMKRAIQRIAAHLPVVTANDANAGELKSITSDSAAGAGGYR